MKSKKIITQRIKELREEKLKHNRQSGSSHMRELNKQINLLEWVLE